MPKEASDLSGASSKRASSIEVGVWEGRKGSSQELSRLKSPRRVGVVVGDNFLEVREGLARPCAAEGAKVVGVREANGVKSGYPYSTITRAANKGVCRRGYCR